MGRRERSYDLTFPTLSWQCKVNRLTLYRCAIKWLQQGAQHGKYSSRTTNPSADGGSGEGRFKIVDSGKAAIRAGGASTIVELEGK